MDYEPKLPIPISQIGDKYLLFDINVITYLRRVHHMCGVMSGTLPQSPSQNVFLGLPVQIMPEEAQLLVEKGVGYIVDDIRAHENAVKHADASMHAEYMAEVRRRAEQVSKIKNDEKNRMALSKRKSKPNSHTQQQLLEDTSSSGSTTPPIVGVDPETDTKLFDSTSTLKPTSSTTSLLPREPLHALTPTTSSLFLPPPSPPITPSPRTQQQQQTPIPNLPQSYPLYRHMNSKSYFITPGLRFGCQYTVYPGDPLRFHSHFLAVGVTWDEEINLMDIVGGGRLGTGVKKGFVIGGEEPAGPASVEEEEGGEERIRMRTFSVEWAAM